jgi:hypothetical protein
MGNDKNHWKGIDISSGCRTNNTNGNNTVDRIEKSHIGRTPCSANEYSSSPQKSDIGSSSCGLSNG